MTTHRHRIALAAIGLCAVLAAAGWQATHPISSYAPATSAASNDVLAGVDVSDTTMAASGTTKRFPVSVVFGSPSNGNLIGWEGAPTPILVGSGLSLTGTGPYTLAATGGGGGGSGTVTSVGLTVPSGLTVTGSPVTSSGTLAIGGTLGVPAGGTGLGTTPTNGQLLIGNGSNYTLATLTAGANITVTNSAGGITIASSGGSASAGGTNGQVQYNNAGALGGFTASGDATINTATGAVAVTRTGGVAFAASATTDTTTAANISAGTLAVARGGTGAGTLTGLVKGSGTSAFTAASAGTDYLAPAGSGAALTGITAAQVGADPLLATQAVQSAGFSAAAGNFYPVDCTSGSVTATLPTAPADGTRLRIKVIGIAGANVVTVAAGGSDVFNKSAGSTSMTLNALFQTITLQYRAAGAIWYVASADVSTGGYAAGTNIGISTAGGTRTLNVPTTGLTITQHAGTIAAPSDGATITLDLSTSDWFAPAALGGNRTLAITNPTVGQQFSVVLLQDGTGSRTVTWFSGILWAGGSAPTLTTTAAKRDVFTFKCISSGVYMGFVAGQNL